MKKLNNNVIYLSKDENDHDEKVSNENIYKINPISFNKINSFVIKSKNFTESIPKESVTDWSKDNNVITDQELVLNLTKNGISYMLKRVLKQGKIALTEIHKLKHNVVQ